MRIAGYARISQDRGGEALGVERQLEDIRELAERGGHELVQEFVDNNVSAYSGKPRPAFRGMLELVRSGAVDAIAVYHLDRLYRSPKELEEILTLAEERSLSILATSGDSVDLTTSDGQLAARILIAVARKSSDDARRRIKSQKAAAAQRGEWTGGGRRPYGYRIVGGKFKDGKHARIEVDREEALVVRELVDSALAGHSLYRMVASLNARRIPSSYGGRWAPTRLKRLLLRAFHNGRLRNGVRGNWPALISDEEHAALQARLANDMAQWREGRGYVLSGLVHCAHCGTPLTGSAKQYRCDPQRGGCYGASMKTQMLDSYLLGLVRVRAEQVRSAEPRAPRRPAADRDVVLADIADVQRRLDQLAADYADGLLDGRQLKIVSGKLNARMEELQIEVRRVAEADLEVPFWSLDDEDFDHAYDWPQEGRLAARALVRALTERVTLSQGRSHPEERVSVEWREHPRPADP